MKHVSTKKYGHSSGFSCCFRQWRAKSHCSRWHGYPLAFEFVFESEALDANNWVVDFGNLKWLKAWLEHMFDHTTLLATDDPHFEKIIELDALGIIDVRVVDAVGCEKVAQLVFEHVSKEIYERYDTVTLRSVQVWEHEGNSARYEL